MLPQVQVMPQYHSPRPRYRPISLSDTAATTGLAINPVGAMVPMNNQYGAYGAQGAFGAMMPMQPGDPYAGMNTALRSTMQTQSPTAVPTNYRTLQTQSPTATPTLYGNNQSLSPTYVPTSGTGNYTPGRFSGAVMSGHIQNIRRDPNYLNNLSPETRSAVQRMLGLSGQAEGAGQQQQFDPTKPYGGFENKGGRDNTDYANTKAAQYYEATNTPFLEQQRWDPDKKKYVSLGSYFGIYGKGGGRRRGGGGRAGTPQVRRMNEKRGWVLSNSFINFNTATG